jgi:hypothetical protein
VINDNKEVDLFTRFVIKTAETAYTCKSDHKFPSPTLHHKIYYYINCDEC